MTFFALGGIAGVVGIVINSILVQRFSREYARRFSGEGMDRKQPSDIYGISDRIFSLWLDRALDTASGLPALIVTAAGLADLSLFDHGAGVGVVIIVTAGVAIYLINRVDPQRPPKKWNSSLLRRISKNRFGKPLLSLSGILLLCNVAGLLLATIGG